MILGGKGVLNWRLEAMKLTITIGTHLSYSGARMQGLPSTAKSDVYSRKLRSLLYLANYVFSWCYSSAWRFNPSDVFSRPRMLQSASAYPTPYSLGSTRRSWILSDSEGLEMGDGKITGTNKP
jgi:hypothetical protein